MPELVGGKTRVFLSYSRKDAAFTRRLADALAAADYVADFDRTDFDPDNVETGISAEDEWWKRLQAMIAAADAMVFIVSPDSAASKICDEEIAYARSLGKRIIPVLLRPIDFSVAPPRLAALNVKLSFEHEAAFGASVQALTAVLDLDVAWHREGSRLMALATKWDQDGRPEAQLLPSGGVDEAEAWAARRPASAQQLGELLLHYLDASRAKARADRDRLLTITGRAFVKPAEQALAEGRFDAALRIAAAGMILSEDEGMRLVPERAATIAGAARRTASVLALMRGDGGQVLSASFSSDCARVLTSHTGGGWAVWEAASGRRMSSGRRSGAIHEAAFSPDGARIAVACAERFAEVFDASSGNGVAYFRHGDEVTRAAFSPDGTRIVTACYRTARVWHATKDAVVKEMIVAPDPKASGVRHEIATLAGHRDDITAAVFSPDGALIATGSKDRTVRIWDATDGREIAILAGAGAVLQGSAGIITPLGETVLSHGWTINSIAFSRDGARLVSAGADREARVWDATTWQGLVVLKGHEASVVSAAFSPDGARVVTASEDATARIWDAADGREIAILRGHGQALVSAAFSADGGRVVTASTDRTARIWDAADGKALAVLDAHEEPLSGAALSADGTRVLTAASDGARIWDAASAPPEIAILRGKKDYIRAASFSPDGVRVVTVTNGGWARVWEVESGREIAALKHEDYVGSAAFSPDGARIVSAAGDGSRIWDWAGERLIAKLDALGPCLGAAFTPDGAQVVTRPDARTRRVFATASGREVATMRAPKDAEERRLTFSPDGTRCVFPRSGAQPLLWDASEGREVATLAHEGSLNAVAFSADDAMVATSGHDRAIRIWEAKSGRLLATLQEENAAVQLVFSRDGARLFAKSIDNHARVWDLAARRQLSALETPVHGDVAFSPDGARLFASLSAVRFWDVASGRFLAEFDPGGIGCKFLALSPDWTRACLAFSDGHFARIWDLSRLAALSGDIAEVLAASLVNGRGLTTETERGDLLMQATPENLHEAVMAQLSPEQRARVARRIELLSRPLHPNAYLAPSQRLGYDAPVR